MLKRPYHNRIIAGVGIGFAERYNIPVFLVRLFLVASFLASPLVLLLYLLFAISIPDERKVASNLREREPQARVSQREHFERFSSLLVHRLADRRSGMSTSLIAIILLFLGAITELPHVEGTAFYWAHPLITGIAGDLAWWGPILFYMSAAALFAVPWSSKGSAIVWPIEPLDQYLPGNDSLKIVGGISGGLSRVLRIDAAYLRVLWIALNFLTMGLAGVVYLLLWYWKRSWSKPGFEENHASEPTENKRNFRGIFRFVIAMLLLLLGAICIATQTRIFFFNQEFLSGVAFAAIGIICVWHGMSNSFQASNSSWLLFGSALFLVGIYLFASAIGHFQVDTIARFEVAEIIAAIAFAYIAIGIFFSESRRIALYCALAFAVGAAMIAFHVSRPEYLAGIIRFYEFFYPIIFAALGLWITFEP